VSAARVLALLAVSIVMAGCTALQLTYNNVDTLINWRAAQYFGFEDEKKAEFERRMQRFLAWHRRSEIPLYARMADDLAGRLSRGVSQADLVWGYDSFQTFLRRSLVGGAAELGPMLDSLTPAEVARFQERLEKENRDFAKEHGLGEPPEERRAMRVKRNVKRMEDWIGSLTDAQLARVVLYSKRAPLDDELRLRDRKRSQAEILAMVRKKEAGKRLVALAQAWDQGRDPAYEAKRLENLKEYYSMLLDLDKMLTAEQRERAVNRLRGFAQDFSVLAAQVSAR
jgi:hypothetical protein